MIRAITTALALLLLASPALASNLDDAPAVDPGKLMHASPAPKHGKGAAHALRRAPVKVRVFRTGPAGGPHYTNVDGIPVHSPMRAAKAPEGATCQCNDGTYSFAQHRRGACNHHGGVKVWL